jgi:hypothetical protein
MMPLLSRLLLVLLALVATPCHADQWLPPQPQTYESPDKTFRLLSVVETFGAKLAAR